MHQEDVAELVEEHLAKEEPERLLHREPETQSAVVDFEDIPFFKKQTRIVLKLRRNRSDSIEEYIARDILRAKAPQDAARRVTRLEEILLYGAGFPTGLKWEFTRKANGSPKYVVCNADEGDPGAFMDRSTIEGDPHRLLEGMTIAGYAVGASHGYVYIRAEYPLAVERLHIAIARAGKKGSWVRIS